MKIVCENKLLDINMSRKPFGFGSEGKVYKVMDQLYKIYYPEMLFEGENSKLKNHKLMLDIPTKNVILPNELIYTEIGSYVGYRTDIAPGSQKDKKGMLLTSSEKVIENIRLLQNDFNILSENYIATADVTPVNYIFDQDNNDMYIIDPGRYKTGIFLLKSEYYKQNNENLKNLIMLIIMNDLYSYKPLNSKRKLIELKNLIIELYNNSGMMISDFFEKELSNQKNLYEYSKSLGKKIR